MKTIHTSWLAAGLTVLSLACLTPDRVQASPRDCSGLPAQLSQDPLRAEGYHILDREKLYRRQDRPWAFIPTGQSFLVRAPAGVTEADLFRAALCHQAPNSPLGVEGAKLQISRRGDAYELRITADQRSAALEIQHRAEAL